MFVITRDTSNRLPNTPTAAAREGDGAGIPSPEGAGTRGWPSGMGAGGWDTVPGGGGFVGSSGFQPGEGDEYEKRPGGDASCSVIMCPAGTHPVPDRLAPG